MPDRFDANRMRTVRHYRERAAELRQQAQVAMSERLRELLLENAALYDRLAEWAERRKGDPPDGE